jgi:hypothetical protein
MATLASNNLLEISTAKQTMQHSRQQELTGVAYSPVWLRV